MSCVAWGQGKAVSCSWSETGAGVGIHLRIKNTHMSKGFGEMIGCTK
jgi:hypothetical protein